MRTLAVISRKGGVGKTTLSVNLAVSAWQAGIKTVVADLDSQRSAGAWLKARGARPGPAVIETTAGKLFPMWSAAGNSGCELMVLDTPASAEAETLQALRLADLVLLVSRPNYFDVSALTRSIELMRQFEKPGLIVLNQAPSRRNGLEPESVLKAIRALKLTGVPIAPMGLRHRASFPASAAHGLSVDEYDPDGYGAREIDGVWNQVRELLERTRVGAPDPGRLAPGPIVQGAVGLPA
jgi:chromosome partitioning protein